MISNIFSKRIGITALFLVVLAVVFCFSLLQMSIKNIESELQSFFIPTVEYKGIAYEIQDGKILDGPMSPYDTFAILSLAKFSVLERINPFFALEGTSLDSLSDEMKELQTLVAELSTFYSDEHESKLVAENLHAFSFYEEIIMLERFRRTVVENPSSDGAETYQEQFNTTTTEYLVFLKQLLNVFTELSDPEGEKYRGSEFHFWGGAVTFDMVQDKLSSMIDQVESRTLQQEERYRCLESMHRNCESLAYTTVLPTAALQEAPMVITPELLERIGRNKDLYHQYHDPDGTYAEENYVRKVVVLANSPCYDTDEPVFYSLMTNTNVYGEQIVRDVLLNDIYFRDLSKNQGASPWLENLYSQNIEYELQSAENSYVCLQSGEVYMYVSTLNDIHETVFNNSSTILEIDGDTPDDIKELHAIELTVIQSPYIAEQNIVAYIAQIESLLMQYGETGLARYVGKEQVLLFSHLLSVWKQQSSSVDHLILWMRSTLIHTKTYYLFSGNIPNLTSVFMVVGSPVVSLLGFNASIYDTSIDFYELAEPSQILFGSHLISYEKELRSQISIPQLRWQLKRVREITYTSAEQP